ncbi:hypothetical protein SynMINOS11_01230 [Synechococcus sp. Minos11]|nr:hypothetical protein SynMINOS11_01230 [Synechococcus sp. Minos11]
MNQGCDIQLSFVIESVEISVSRATGARCFGSFSNSLSSRKYELIDDGWFR